MTVRELRLEHKKETGCYPANIKVAINYRVVTINTLIPYDEKIEQADRKGLLNYIYWLEEKVCANELCFKLLTHS
jgi:hypothetical protein